MDLEKNNDIVLEDENGNEILMKVLFYYENEERDAKYFFIYEPSDEESVFLFKMNQETNSLDIVEDEDELEEGNEMLEAYYNDETIATIK